MLAADPLGDDGHVQRMGHVDNGLAQRQLAAVRLDVVDEGAVDFQEFELVLLDVGQRRIAGAEVVEREGDAVLGQEAQLRFHGFIVLEQGAFGDFEHDRMAWQILGHVEGEAAGDALGALGDLERRDVDAHLERLAVFA